MSGTRAKFYVQGLTLLPGKDAGIRLDLSAVTRGDRNASWAKATPIATFSMQIENPVAAKWWEDFMQAARSTGRQPELYVDIYPSEDGWPGDGHAFRLGDWPENHYSYGKCGACGMGKDDTIMEWDQTLGKNVEKGPAHPNG